MSNSNREAPSSLAAERAARVRAEATVFQRDHMLSILSHDLRGPLNAIHSWSHVLERKLDPNDASVQRALNGVRTGVEQQVRLIEEVVDTTRQATRHLRIERAPARVGALLQAVLDNIEQSVAAPRGAGIDSDLSGLAEQATLDIDAERVWQAVWVMLDHAMSQGRTDAGVRLRAASEEGGLRASVEFQSAADTAQTAALRADQVPPPLALPLRVAEAHGGRFVFEQVADPVGIRRLVLSLPARAPLSSAL